MVMMSYMEGLDEYILNMCDLIQTHTKKKNIKGLQETAKILLEHKIMHQKRLETIDAIRKQINDGLKK